MQDTQTVSARIAAGETSLGIEFGSTRIKAVLIDDTHEPLATGEHEWGSKLVDGFWTYDLADAWSGLQKAYANLAAEVAARYDTRLTTVGALGFSALMHGYLAFDSDDELLVPFRTYQNTTTGQAAAELTNLFQQNIPQRWSIAHLHQAILNGEEHVGSIHRLNTLASFVHWKLTGEHSIGIGDGSGMFPIDSTTGDFDAGMIAQFDDLVADRGYAWKVRDLLPTVLRAGQQAGTLTDEGAKLLDPTGTLSPGIPMAPPEGDAGTGMVATNSIARRTANVSAGTSIFAMVVLEAPLKTLHEEIDLVTTPAGDVVAMAHCINGARDSQAWVNLFGQFAEALGVEVDTNTLFETLYRASLDGAADGDGMLNYNYLAGEHIVGLDSGRPLFVRTPNSDFMLGNFMRTHLYSALAALRMGMDILFKEEGIEIDSMFAHGGFFKTPGVMQRYLAAAMYTPVSVGDVAGEGGAWGMALLGSFLRSGGDSLADWLSESVFADAEIQTMEPDPADVAGFEKFMDRYRAGLAIEKSATESLKL